MNLKQLTAKEKRLRSYYPLPVELVRNLDEWFEFEFVYNSCAIDGNALEGTAAVVFVDKGITARGKTIEDHLELINHIRALNWVKHSSKRKFSFLKEEDIHHLHFLLMEGVDDQNVGKYRKTSIRVQNSCIVAPDPRDVPELMAEFIAWLNQDHISHPVDLAAQAHLKFLKIRPFVSGNSPIARLLMNLMLLSFGYPITYIRVEDRECYYASLESAYLGNQSDYLDLVYGAVDRSLEKYLYNTENSLSA